MQLHDCVFESVTIFVLYNIIIIVILFGEHNYIHLSYCVPMT